MADPAPDPAKPNPAAPPAQQGQGQGAAPKPMAQWIQEGPGGGLGVLATIALAALGWIGFFLLRPDDSSFDQSRSMLAVIFSVGTITTALCLILGAFLSAGSETVKDRFTLANQVLTPLIGIMGTILGFYFGTSQDKKTAEPLAIVDVMVAKNTVKPGESLPITAIVSGGQGPWEFSLTFANDALPAVRRKVASPNLRETVAIPAAQTGQLGLTVEVTDSLGTTAKLERKVGEWVNIEAAPAPAPAPAPPSTKKKVLPEPDEVLERAVEPLPLERLEPLPLEPLPPAPPAPRPEDAPQPPNERAT